MVKRLGELLGIYRWARQEYRRKDYIKNYQTYWESKHLTLEDLKAVGPSEQDNRFNKSTYLEMNYILHEFILNIGLYYADRSILEIGAGTGYFSKSFFNKTSGFYAGMDISYNSVLKTQKALGPGNGIIFQSDITRPMSLRLKFDVIFMLDVVQHIVDKDQFNQAMWNIKKLIAPDGVFICTSYFDPPQESHEGFNVRYWTKEDFVSALGIGDAIICRSTYNSKTLFAVKNIK